MSHGLAPRPGLPSDEAAAVMAAVEEIMKEQAQRSPVVDTVPAWRFSGRWFNSGPYANRRPQRAS
ncbi:MAG: hypothetical protein ABSG24_08210 [Acidimicrobiales bacterium]